tara:strand:+ start:429 stop:656 length:228 start_codon:yes stop_codon:yes gene_type:complete
MAKNTNQHYLPEEDDLIKEMSKQGYANWVIADRLGRTELTIYFRRRLLKVPCGPCPTTKKYQRMKDMRQTNNNGN